MASDIEHQFPAEGMGIGSSEHHRQPNDHETPVSWNCLNITFDALKYLAAAPLVAAKFLLEATALAAAFLTSILIAPLALMVVICLPSKLIAGKYASSSSTTSTNGMAGMYKQSSHQKGIFHRIMDGSYTLVGRSGMLLSVWLVFNVSVPCLRRLTLLGCPLWRWILLAVILTAGFIQATVVYFVPAAVPHFMNNKFQIPKNVKPFNAYFKLGLFPSSTLVIYFGMILLSWLLYFRTEDGLKRASTPHPEALEYVTWTCVSLFVGSILLFFKTLFLLKWRTHAIYRRFQPRILITGVKFIYLSYFSWAFSYGEQEIGQLRLIEEYVCRWDSYGNFSFITHTMSREIDPIHLQDMGAYLVALAAIVKPLKEDGVPQVVDLFENRIFENDERCQLDSLSDLLTDSRNQNPNIFYDHRYKTAMALFSILQEQCGSSDFTFADLKKLLVDAHKNCVNMGRTLDDAAAMVTRLDIFVSFIICIAVALLWLLVTGIATTQVLVTIATPLLALTFIFGDSAKAFFQGLIFCFGTHAFDVGDRCIIDETELEVKSIGILTTTFIKIGAKEKIMYANSELTTKAIVNHGWQPDPTDVVELTLDFSTTPPAHLQKLEAKLQQFFSDPLQKDFFEKSHEVMVNEIGDSIKVKIHFTHVLNIHEMTHGQCFHKKITQRSTLLKKINHFLDQKPPVGNDVNNGESQISSQVLARSQSAT